MIESYDIPLLIGIASSSSVSGYRVEILRCRAGGWDIFYFHPRHELAEYNSWAEDWGEALQYGEMYGVRWTGGSEWREEYPPI